MDDFARNTGLVALAMAALLGLDGVPRLLPHSYVTRRLIALTAMMRNGALNSDDLHSLAAGYYEGLEDTVRIAQGAENNDYRVLDGFLRYEFKPNLKRPYAAGMRITNSLGMPNPEYGYAKPAGVRRVALLGDSISIGPYGHDYEALLEQRLNERDRPPGVDAFQILNFSVPGYGGVQMMDVAFEKAVKFHPDVYVTALTSQEATHSSLNHLVRLIQKSTDLKYPYLRDVAAKARVQTTDRKPMLQAKLLPFFVPVTRWAQEQIRDLAAAHGAGLVIVLMPAVMDANVTAADFDVLHEVADPVGVPVIDLRETFRNADLKSLQVVANADIHPNARGHEMIMENLYTKLRAQPKAWKSLVGADGAARGKTF
jgi:hypothetical protein